MNRRIGLACLLVALAAAALPAVGAVVSRRLATGLTASAVDNNLPQAWVAPAKTPPVIDGKLDETAWAAAEPFVLGPRKRAGRISPTTRVRMIHGDGKLFVGITLAEPAIEKLKRTVQEADGPAYRDDSVELYIAPRPARDYFQMILSAAGSIYDRVGHGNAAAWNCRAVMKVGVGKDAWTIEIAIPMKALGVGGKVPSHWRANVYRNRHAGPEGSSQAWSPTPTGNYDRPETFGHLYFTPQAPWAGRNKPEHGAEGIVIEDLEAGALLRFDLSALPKGTVVHRARLLGERRMAAGLDAEIAPVELYPLTAPPAEGRTPKLSGGRLRLVGPWYDAFELTEAVRRWVAAGQAQGAVYVKSLPGWRRERTFLDVVYEGEADSPPAQVSGLAVFHRAGQTFITWKEVEPLITAEQTTWGAIKSALATAKDAVRYRVYAGDRPITAANIATATLLAEVAPLSAYNVNARNKEYLIGQAMIQPDQIGELARNYNGYMHTWHMDSARMDRYPVRRFVIDQKKGPLPVGTGLYVHHPAKAGGRYYAVVSCREGVENLVAIGRGNALSQPVAETVGVGVPVRQGKGLWGPYFDYPGTRWVYVQWCGPPLAPKPNMYFNWSVLIPPQATGKVAAELYFHPGGYSYAQPGKKAVLGSIQLATHDYPASGWYGFNDAWGTLKSLTDGVVSNHTQKRIIAFLDWAKQTLPIDPDRVLAVGSDGAAALALNYPEQFAFVRITGFDSAVLNPKAARQYEAIWGPQSPRIKDEQGRGNWEWADLDKLALSQAKDLPLFTCLGYSWGRYGGYAKGRGRFYDAMLKARQPLIACWGWNGARNLQPVDKYTGTWRGLQIARTTAVPAFANSTADHDQEQSGVSGGGYGWRDVRDTPQEFAITVAAGRKGSFDLTPRRLQRFKVRPNERLTWEAVTVPGRRGETGPPQSGTVTADAAGRVTIPELECHDRSGGLTIRIRRAK